MYPYFVIDLGGNLRLGLYDICLMIAILICLVLYRVFADRQHFKAKIQNFALITALFAIIINVIVLRKVKNLKLTDLS